MSSIYKFGDRVVVNGNKGTVVSVFTKKASVYYCTVRFDDENLIPREMDFDQNQIHDQSAKTVETKTKEVKCNCGTFAVYGKVPANAHRPYCALQTKEEEPPPFELKEEQSDFFKAFEAMLDDDDDDDFGFYIP